MNKWIDEKIGYGLKITHRDDHYKAKKIFFKDETVCDEWVSELKIYKGIDIRKLY